MAQVKGRKTVNPHAPGQGSPPAKRTCAATTKRGNPCPATPMPDGFCYWHSPLISNEEKRVAQIRGGLNGHRAVIPGAGNPRIGTPKQIREYISETLGLVTRGELDRGIGYLRIYGASVAKQVFESDVLARVEELEKLARRGDLRREERIIDME